MGSPKSIMFILICLTSLSRSILSTDNSSCFCRKDLGESLHFILFPIRLFGFVMLYIYFLFTKFTCFCIIKVGSSRSYSVEKHQRKQWPRGSSEKGRSGGDEGDSFGTWMTSGNNSRGVGPGERV